MAGCGVKCGRGMLARRSGGVQGERGAAWCASACSGGVWGKAGARIHGGRVRCPADVQPRDRALEGMVDKAYAGSSEEQIRIANRTIYTKSVAKVRYQMYV